MNSSAQGAPVRPIHVHTCELRLTSGYALLRSHLLDAFIDTQVDDHVSGLLVPRRPFTRIIAPSKDCADRDGFRGVEALG